MKFLSLLLLTFVLPLSLFSKEYTIEDVPNPTHHGGFVSNPDSILSPAEVDTLEAYLAITEDSTTCQVAVVAVSSIGDENPKDFASKLFNHWGIGNAEKNNGVLIFLVMDQKRIEIETGYGLEEKLPDVVCGRILREQVVPYFKQGKFGSGIIAGVVQIYITLMSEYTPETNSSYEYSDADYEAMRLEARKSDMSDFRMMSVAGLVVYLLIMLFDFISRMKKGGFTHLYKRDGGSLKYKMPIGIPWWLVMYVIFPTALLIFPFTYEPERFLLDREMTVFGGIIYLYMGVALLDRRRRQNNHVTKVSVSAYQKYTDLTLSNNKWIWVTLFFPLHLIPYWFWHNFKKGRLRKTPLECNGCQKKMHRLNEIDDDQKLGQAQILEEKVKSIDYDVWMCSDCSKVEVLKYVNHWSSYKICIKCKAKTYYLDSDKTVTKPTYSSTGRGVKTFLCKNCDHSHSESYTIAKRERPSSSSSGGGSSRSYGGGSSGGGSSRSFGGGRSGGGGAGSSW